MIKETIYAHNVYHAWISLLNILLIAGDEISPRDQKTKEILGLQLRLGEARRNIINDPIRKLNYKFLIGQWLATFAGVEDRNLERYNKNIVDYEDDGRGGHYPSYGPRLLPQWPFVIKSLIDDEHTRQAVASIWEAQILPNEKHVPCTLSMQFLLRNRRLNNIVTMRSSDAWLGIPYDVFNFSQMTNVIAAVLTHIKRQVIEVGALTLNLGSSHLYSQHWEKAREILKLETGTDIKSPLIPQTINSPLVEIQQFLKEPDKTIAWETWPWPYNMYAKAMKSESNATALEILRQLDDERNPNA
jgi:thymidylate synthase